MGCTRYAEFQEDRNQLLLSLSDAKIEDVSIVDWTVGDGKKLSQGIMIKVQFPQLSSDFLERLRDHYQADSWGLRVNFHGQGRMRNIAHLYVPILPDQQRRGQGRLRSPRATSFRINYATVRSVGRFANLPCPVNDHRMQIQGVRLQKSQRDSKLLASPFQRRRVNARVSEIGHFPVSVTGGTHLAGRYEVELALYNRKKGHFISQFYGISNFAVVESEREKRVPECDGYRPPEDQGGLENFRFGR